MHNSALSKKKRYKDGITVMQLILYALNSENIFWINSERNSLWTCFFVLMIRSDLRQLDLWQIIYRNGTWLPMHKDGVI